MIYKKLDERIHAPAAVDLPADFRSMEVGPADRPPTVEKFFKKDYNRQEQNIFFCVCIDRGA